MFQLGRVQFICNDYLLEFDLTMYCMVDVLTR